MRHRVVLPMGVALLAAGTVLRWSDQNGEVLNLRPYLPGPVPAGVLSEHLRTFLEGFGEGFGLAALGGVAAVLLFLVLEALGRHVWKHAYEAAALLPAAGFAALPAQTAFHRVDGGETLLAALVVLLLGCWLCCLGHRAVGFLGAALAACSPAVHPAMLALAPGAGLLLGVAGRCPGTGRTVAATVGVTVVGAGMFLLGGGGFPAPPLHSSLETLRLDYALELLASSPRMALWSAPRDLLPTGFEAAAGLWPVAYGLVAWGLLLGWGMLTAGIRQAFALGGLALLAGVLPPLCTPGWVPGERGMALLPLVPLAALVSLLLGTIRGAVPRDVCIVLSLAVVGIAGLNGFRRESEELIAVRRVVFQLPYHPVAGFTPGAEPDPARLVLFSHDMLAYEEARRRKDPRLEDRRRRLLAAKAAIALLAKDQPVIDGLTLGRMAQRLADIVNDPPLTGDRDFWDRMSSLEIRLLEVRKESEKGEPDAWYPTVQRAMQDLLPSAYDIWFADEQHPRVRRWRYSFANLARRCALWATEVGELQFSIPLREFLATVTEGHVKNHARALAILALDRIARLDIVTATRELDEAIPHLPANSVLGAVARAARARCRLLKGDPGQALKDVNRAWSQLSRDSRGGNLLAQHAQPDSRDYWMLVDLLMMRYELVRKHDRGLESQARRDLERAIDPSLVFGIRRVPALAFRGRLHHLVGDDDKARPLLLEMRKIAPKTLLERGGGPNGRMDVPTWRLIGLRTLQDVLDPTTDAALLEEIDAEVRALRPL